MQLIRHLAGAGISLAVFILLTVLGIASGGAGWIAVSLLCAWPLFWAVTAWTLRGLKITVTPANTPTAATTNKPRRIPNGEVYN